MGDLVRLNKFLADSGLASRRKCDEFISAGSVKINGKVVAELGTKIDPDIDKVEVDGKSVSAYRNKLVYYKLNKPVGYECSLHPSGVGAKSVYDLVKTKERVFTVGRLDQESEGLIFLTNDGRFAYLMTHPKFHKEKEYEVTADRSVTDNELKQFAKGVIILGKRTAPARVERLSGRKFAITIHEGMNRQIRRMCRKLGLRVHKLKRVRIGSVELDSMIPGELRPMRKSEYMALTEGK